MAGVLAGCAGSRAAQGRATDGRFKMVHQVAASHDGQEFLLVGYMLGKPSGEFRVSAASVLGPRVFDVAFVGGAWQSKIHYPPLAGKLDPQHMGRAIQRIYFARCPGEAPRCPVEGDGEVDALAVTRDAEGRVVRKDFSLGSKPVLSIHYSEFQAFADGPQAGLVRVEHPQYQLKVALDEYVPGFGFDDATLVP